MQEHGRRISIGKRGGRSSPHPEPLVETFLLLTDGFKDEFITEYADLSPSYLSNIRSRRTADPGIGKIQRMLEYMGYELVILKRKMGASK